MATTSEVEGRKAARQRRGRRYYTAALLGPPCGDSRCHLKLDKRLADLGENTHATCSTDARDLLALDAPNRRAAREEATG